MKLYDNMQNVPLPYTDKLRSQVEALYGKVIANQFKTKTRSHLVLSLTIYLKNQNMTQLCYKILFSSRIQILKSDWRISDWTSMGV